MPPRALDRATHAALARAIRIVLVALLAVSSSTAGSPGPGIRTASLAAPLAAPSLAQLVGQKLMVAMTGTTPSADLLGRIGRGEVGGVILFGRNITTAGALVALTTRLREAAAEGGQPPLLIATDQEGGTVRRVPWAPPTLSVPAMGAAGSASAARAQGTATGRALRCAGIDADLAPVADVPASTASFMYRQGRTWSFDATLTATLSDAFAGGVEAAGAVPTIKHFPGIGYATANTDANVVTITASQAALAPGLRPYRLAIAHGIPMVMLSNATYTAYDDANGAGWSSAIVTGLLRGTLGFTGVTITDSLSGTARARGVSATSLTIRAATAGTDMITLAGSEASTAATYASLLARAEDGRIPRATLEASYARILALKEGLAGPIDDATAPTERAVDTRFVVPSTLGSTRVPLATTWSATDPCGISAYSLERSTNGGAWLVQEPAGVVPTSTTQSLAIGSRYRYRVAATDGAGNVAAWRAGPTIEPLLAQSTSGAVAYGGGWRTVASRLYSGGATRYASAAGARARYTFTGSAIAWVAAVGPTRGSAKVYLDGVFARTVDLRSSTTILRRIVFARAWRTSARHTIAIVVVGTAGHPRVDIDAFVRLVRP